MYPGTSTESPGRIATTLRKSAIASRICEYSYTGESETADPDRVRDLIRSRLLIGKVGLLEMYTKDTRNFCVAITRTRLC